MQNIILDLQDNYTVHIIDKDNNTTLAIFGLKPIYEKIEKLEYISNILKYLNIKSIKKIKNIDITISELNKFIKNSTGFAFADNTNLVKQCSVITKPI